MQELRYERPQTIADAVGLLARDGARALAGGTDLIPQLREGRRAAAAVVDLKHVSDLTRVQSLSGGGLRVGAAASVAHLAADRAFASMFPALLASAQLIGSIQIQSRATLGGNLANAAPSADAVPLLIALDAEAEIAGRSGSRRAPVESIPTGPGQSTLAQGEVVVALELPAPAPMCAARYLRFTPRREMDIAIAGSGVRLDLAGDGTVSAARIVLASVAPVPLRARLAEAMLVGERPTGALLAAAAAKAAGEARPISDTRGSADYRRELVSVLTRRALADCLSQLRVQTP